MSISIGGGLTNGLVTRMQTALAAAKAAEQSQRKNEVAEPITVNGPRKDVGEARGSAWPGRAASSDGPRVEVDRRTEDAKSVRTTVILYSDGSSESVTQMKADELTAPIDGGMAKQSDADYRSSTLGRSITEKGFLVNKTA